MDLGPNLNSVESKSLDRIFETFLTFYFESVPLSRYAAFHCFLQSSLYHYLCITHCCVNQMDEDECEPVFALIVEKSIGTKKTFHLSSKMSFATEALALAFNMKHNDNMLVYTDEASVKPRHCFVPLNGFFDFSPLFVHCLKFGHVFIAGDPASRTIEVTGACKTSLSSFLEFYRAFVLDFREK